MAESLSINDRDWFSPLEVSKLIGVNKATVYRWIANKQIPEKWISVLPNGYVRIHKDGFIRDRPRRRRK